MFACKKMFLAPKTDPILNSVYGVRIDTTNPNPLSAVTYTDEAIGTTAGSSIWDTKEIYKNIK